MTQTGYVWTTRRYAAADVGCFAYISYWRSWDLVIAVEGPSVTVAAVTPNGWSHPKAGLWVDDTLLAKPRTHGTPLGRGDRVCRFLPNEVADKIVRHGYAWLLDPQLPAQYATAGWPCDNQ